MNKTEFVGKYQTLVLLREYICFGKWNNYKNNHILSHKDKFSKSPKAETGLATFSEHKAIKLEINHESLNKNKNHMEKNVTSPYKY